MLDPRVRLDFETSSVCPVESSKVTRTYEKRCVVKPVARFLEWEGHFIELMDLPSYNHNA